MSGVQGLKVVTVAAVTPAIVRPAERYPLIGRCFRGNCLDYATPRTLVFLPGPAMMFLPSPAVMTSSDYDRLLEH